MCVIKLLVFIHVCESVQVRLSHSSNLYIDFDFWFSLCIWLLLAERTCRHLDGVDVRAVTEVCRRPIGREVQCVDLTGRHERKTTSRKTERTKKQERDAIIHVNLKSVVWFLSSWVQAKAAWIHQLIKMLRNISESSRVSNLRSMISAEEM